MTEGKWLPGFLLPAMARAAGIGFYAKTNGKRGVEGRDFHIVQNEHGRWPFAEGPSPKDQPRPLNEAGGADD